MRMICCYIECVWFVATLNAHDMLPRRIRIKLVGLLASIMQNTPATFNEKRLYSHAPKRHNFFLSISDTGYRAFHTYFIAIACTEMFLLWAEIVELVALYFFYQAYKHLKIATNYKNIQWPPSRTQMPPRGNRSNHYQGTLHCFIPQRMFNQNGRGWN